MTANERLQDAAIGHAIDLQRYSNGVVRRLVGILNRTDADLFFQLTAAPERLPADAFTVERLDSLLGQVRSLNVAAYQRLERELTAELREFVAVESTHQLRLFESAIPAQVQAHVAIAPINAQQVYTAAYSMPFRGRLLREWSEGLEQDKAKRIRDAVRIGYVENEPIAQIVRRIRGTSAKGYSDGLIELDRRNAETIVRSAVSHMAAVTRDRFFEANSDIIKSLAWTSTLDARTTVEICVPRDGKQYHPVTHKPIGHTLAWLGGPGRAHFGCRSTSVPVTKSWRELGIDVDELDPGTRASMDGQVPADQTYGAWLKKQSAARQDEVLGPSRGKMFRAGEPIEKFSNDKGRLLTLKELGDRVPK
jgi:hypothetical protein